MESLLLLNKCHIVANVKNQTIDFYKTPNSKDRITSIYINRASKINAGFHEWLNKMFQSKFPYYTYTMFVRQLRKNTICKMEFNCRHDIIYFQKASGKQALCSLNEFIQCLQKFNYPIHPHMYKKIMTSPMQMMWYDVTEFWNGLKRFRNGLRQTLVGLFIIYTLLMVVQWTTPILQKFSCSLLCSSRQH